MSIQVIMDKVEDIGQGIKRVVITGGEPIEQKELMPLLQALRMKGFEVSVETNGVDSDRLLNLILLFPEVSWVVDYKLPSAGLVAQSSSIQLHNSLSSKCFSKFVISDIEDFKQAAGVAKCLYPSIHRLYFSPAEGLDPAQLFAWMKVTKICLDNNVGYSYQIHKVIFKDFRNEEN